MDYENMSDFEINKRVAGLKFSDIGKIKLKKSHFTNDGVHVYLNGMYFIAFNPCNNPSDAWPIIVSNNISIEMRGDLNSLAYIKGDAPYADKNPLRAAMIVYLMMQGAKC